MSEETDVEIDKVPENKDSSSSKPDSSSNPDEIEENTEDQTLDETKDETSKDEEGTVANVQDDEELRNVVNDEDRWTDNYQFLDDEKLVIDYNG